MPLIYRSHRWNISPPGRFIWICFFPTQTPDAHLVALQVLQQGLYLLDGIYFFAIDMGDDVTLF